MRAVQKVIGKNKLRLKGSHLMIIAEELNREAVKVAGMPLSMHHHRETTSKDIGRAILNHLRHLLLSYRTLNKSRHASKSKATMSPQWRYT